MKKLMKGESWTIVNPPYHTTRDKPLPIDDITLLRLQLYRMIEKHGDQDLKSPKTWGTFLTSEEKEILLIEPRIGGSTKSLKDTFLSSWTRVNKMLQNIKNTEDKKRLEELRGWIKREHDLRFDEPLPEPDLLYDEKKRPKTVAELEPIRDLFVGKEKNVWRISYPGTEFIIPKDIDGLFYIHYLLENPHKEIEVRQLYQSKHLGSSWGDKHYSDMGDEKIGKEGLSKSGGLEMELIDDPARKQYKKRLEEINQDLAEAMRNHDQSRIEELSDEKEKILQQLDSATSITGMDRGLQTDKEKTYRTVKKAINTAISNIRKQSPEIADYLEQTIKTGYVCIYVPL